MDVKQKNDCRWPQPLVFHCQADATLNMTLPGPFTMSPQARDEFYKHYEELAMAFAEAVNAEALD
jgi:5-methyltetrahydropteroyltriglutamate--homocysteine methyltransferase